MIDFERLITALSDAGVDFVIVGGVAATLHGSARLTADIDVAYARDRENLARIARALAPLDPYLRGTPPGLPFTLDVHTLWQGLNFTLTTSAGAIDLLGELTGVESFSELASSAVRVSLFGRTVAVASLDMLLKMKRAAGRPKDLEVISELETIRALGSSDE